MIISSSDSQVYAQHSVNNYSDLLKKIRHSAHPVPVFNGPPKALTSIHATVTPDFSAYILDNHNHLNRTMRKSLANKYRADMMNDHWLGTHQGVAFLTDLECADGQHRFEGVRTSGKIQELLMFFELPKEAKIAIDQQAKRDPIDDMLFVYGVRVDRAMKTVAGGMMLGHSYASTARTVSPATLFDFIEKHQNAVEFAADIFRAPVKGVACRRPVQGVIGRAYYTSDRMKVLEFCEVLRTGIGSGHQHAEIIKLRDFLNSSVNKGNGRDQFVASYRKTSRALHNFLEDTQGDRLIEAPTELFPLPEEV